MKTDTPLKRKGGGSKLTRSEIIHVRLDPKLRYLSELAARKQRRTISSFIEFLAGDYLKYTFLDTKEDTPSLEKEAEKLWSLDPVIRMRKLAEHYPHLLTYNEELELRRLDEEAEARK
jgi:hypothetical protein